MSSFQVTPNMWSFGMTVIEMVDGIRPYDQTASDDNYFNFIRCGGIPTVRQPEKVSYLSLFCELTYTLRIFSANPCFSFQFNDNDNFFSLSLHPTAPNDFE